MWQTYSMQKVADLFGNFAAPQIKKTRRSEREELVQFFAEKINRLRADDSFPPLRISYIRFLLSHIVVRDLYFLKSVCLDSQSRGFRFDVEFWKRVKVATKPGKRTFPKST